MHANGGMEKRELLDKGINPNSVKKCQDTAYQTRFSFKTTQHTILSHLRFE
jgi:hypothetical protein